MALAPYADTSYLLLATSTCHSFRPHKQNVKNGRLYFLREEGPWTRNMKPSILVEFHVQLLHLQCPSRRLYHERSVPATYWRPVTALQELVYLSKSPVGCHQT